MKSVLISIQPYWLFLIIAKSMGWDIGKEKKVEVRKNYPKDENWDKTVKLYCSKNKKSFNQIPEKYQPLMELALGKVIGEFVCDSIYPFHYNLSKGFYEPREFLWGSCLSLEQLKDYVGGSVGYAWHISDLVIYDKPRELSEFRKECKLECDMRSLKEPPCEKCEHLVASFGCGRTITRPPQSWCYVESEVLRKNES